MELVAEPRAQSARPTLESGDRLTTDEFRRRYELRPDIKKAELIDGVVYVAPRVRFSDHGEPHALLILQLAACDAMPGVQMGSNSTVRFADGSEVQPDILIRRASTRGGATRLVDGYVTGPPELCAEVAASSASYDLHTKKELYRRNGVQEYIAWRTEDEAIAWWELVGGAYVPLPVEADGSVKSRVFPGLSLRPAELIDALRRAAAKDELA